ncbi:MAG: hypothetical protein V3U57_06625 [Robiginitomaculum sp.]
MNGSNTLDSLQSVVAQFARNPRQDGQGEVTVLCAPHSHAGTSYVARNMALITAQNLPESAQVLLVEMDIQNNAQSSFFFASENQAIYGVPAGPYDASYGQQPFWRITPSIVNEQGLNLTDAHFMSLNILQACKISFTHFHWENLKAGHNVHIQNARNYWHELRKHYAAIIIDTPALDRSDILETISPEADRTILVAHSRDSRSESLASAYNKIKAMDTDCAGVIFNNGTQRVPTVYGEPT